VNGVPSTNITDGYVAGFDPAIDYFPDKATIRHSAQLSLEYHRHYKVVTVNVRGEPRDRYQYVFLQRGTPAPPGYPPSSIVEVPVRTIALLHFKHGMEIDILNLHRRLVAVDDFKTQTVPGIVGMIESGTMVDPQYGFHKANPEVLIGLKPDVAVMYFWGDPATDSNPKLDEAGVKSVYFADALETTPLGAAEWMKVFAMLVNRERDMERYMASVADQYAALAATARSATPKPTVIANSIYKGAWNMPGGNSDWARYFADAGADYLWADDPRASNNPVAVERVLDRAADVDVWIDPMASGYPSTVEQLLSKDPRYHLLSAARTGEVYVHDAQRVGEKNPFWRAGYANPALVLADFVKIFHPELVPTHELQFYRKLPAR
jgi:iron complex transport system substrate-binding protein